MLVWGLVGLALLVLAVLGVVWLVRRSEGGPSLARHPDHPERILARRYAAGEIDEEDYLRRRSNLEN